MPNFQCPCCGYDGLDVPAYEYLNAVPVPVTNRPPYSQHYGMPSYDVCDCCGFEFGNDDEPGTVGPMAFEDYLANWIAHATPWFAPDKKPQGWSIKKQLQEAGILPPPGLR